MGFNWPFKELSTS